MTALNRAPEEINIWTSNNDLEHTPADVLRVQIKDLVHRVRPFAAIDVSEENKQFIYFLVRHTKIKH